MSSPLSVMLKMKVWAEPGAAFCAAAIAESVASRSPVAGDQRPASSEIGGGLSVADRRRSDAAPRRFTTSIPAARTTARCWRTSRRAPMNPKAFT